MQNSYHTAPRRTQSGATLIVGLVLLLVLTVVGVSGMNTSRVELRMAGNAQFHQDAFQQAESGIDIAIASGAYSTASDQTSTCPDGEPEYGCEAVTHFQTAVPMSDIAFSMGNGVAGGSALAYYFDVVSDGKAPRKAAATHRQSFYVLGPDTGGNQP